MKRSLYGFCSISYAFIFISCLAQAKAQSKSSSSCDFFQGSWVYDHAYPTYDTVSCPFILAEFDCQKNGRPDNLYLKYRWKPTSCTLPRFDGQDFLRRIKGKKILFIGDSLSLNQWQSLTCMLHASSPKSNYTIEHKGGVSTFSLHEYNTSIVLSRNGFLVDLVQEKIGRVLKLDSIENGKDWKGYDMLIFNTWHWWFHKGSKQPWDYIQKGNRTRKNMDRLVAFKKGLNTWSNWVDRNVNPTVTKVFYQGISPAHYDGNEWNETGSTCNGQNQPISGTKYKGSSSLVPAVELVKKVIRKMKVGVTLLDITTLSQLRKDGHPSIYVNQRKLGNDCSHWCLAGVPDTWNQLLYAILATQGTLSN